MRFQGTPGSRYSRYPREEAYERLGVRVIVADRPGYGASSRLPGRGVSLVADDTAELLDHLALDGVHAIGASGGGPHVLAFAARHPNRVEAATVVVGGTPDKAEDLPGMIEINRQAWHAAREGWDAMHRLIEPHREAVLLDPLAGFREIMKTAPAPDQVVMDDPEWQRVMVEDLTEALRVGAEGWADEAMAITLPWDFDPAQVRCSVTWWHGEHDANAPIAAVRRLLADMSGVDLRVWADAGHLEPYLRHDEIIEELLAR